MKTLQDYLDFPCPLSPEWRDCLRDFLIHLYHDYSQSLETVDTYRTMLKQFFSSGKNPQMISQHDIRTFVRSPSKPHHGNPRGEPSASLQNARVTAIRSLYSFASTFMPQGWSHPLYEKPNPTLGLNMRTIPRNPRGFTLEELTRFFSAIPRGTPIGDRDYAIFLFLLTCARRKSEVCQLNVGSIEKCMLTDGLVRKEGYRYSYLGKGRGTQRTYKELPSHVYESIMCYLRSSGRLATACDEDPLFTSFRTDPGRIYTATKKRLPGNNLVGRMHLYMRQCGLDIHKFSLHSFRHASSQIRYSNGQDILSISDILDHRSLQTTRLYLMGLVSSVDPGIPILEKQLSGILRS